VRARAPDAGGFVRVGDVEVHWERFGQGEPSLLFCGVDPIVESRMWKGQVPWFARRHTVVTFDPPGNGRSMRTPDPAAYTDAAFVSAALAVLDAADVDRAVVVGVCQGAGISLLLAAEHPDRVDGVVAINAGLRLSTPHAHRTRHSFDEVLDSDDGWRKENRHYWLRDWPGYCEFFFDQLLPEPHSTKQVEDCVGWGVATTPEIMLAYLAANATSARMDPAGAAELLGQVRCPVLVICGDDDMCQPHDRSHMIAELTGGDLVVLEGAGHLPHARDPVRVDLEICRFVERLPCVDRQSAVAATG